MCTPICEKVCIVIYRLHRMNEEMEEVKRDFKIKDENSQTSAATLILTS